MHEHKGPAKTPLRPFQHIGIDVQGPLPVTEKGNWYIVVAVDWLTKWPEAVAVQEADAQTIAEFLYKDLIARHGIPEEITTDRGTEFNNELIQAMCQWFRIKHIQTIAYHPQGNGLVEQMNQTIKNGLAKLIEKEPR